MRNANIRGRGRSQYSNNFSSINPIVWYVIGAIVAIFIVMKIFSGDGTAETRAGAYMSFLPADAKSTTYITTEAGKKTQITKEENLYTTDTASVEAGHATGKVANSTIDFSQNTEFSYLQEDVSGVKKDVIKFTK